MASRTKRLASEGIRRLAENWGLRGSFGPLYDPGIYASGSDFNPYEGYAPRQQALESRRGEELNRGTGSGATFSGNDYYDRTSTWTSDYPAPDQVENTASLLGRGSEERLAKPAVTGHDLRTSKSPFTLPINHSPPRDAPGGLRFWLIMVSLMATTILSALDLVSAFRGTSPDLTYSHMHTLLSHFLSRRRQCLPRYLSLSRNFMGQIS